MKRWSKEKIRFVIIRTIGNFLVLFSIWGMAMTFGPAAAMEVRYRVQLLRNVHYAVVIPKEAPSPETTVIPTPTILMGKPSWFGQLTGGNKVEFISPVSTQFGIVIPKIGANAPVIINVNPGNPDEYLPELQRGVAHSLGTVVPGVPGNIFLFAHSTDAFWNVGRYNAIFFLLKELTNGDEIDMFYQGIRHIYRVVNQVVVDPSDVQYLTHPLPYEQLTLQTCWPPGTTLKRLIVMARPERDLTK
jgi:LPXTG-site transpeptidase (sortase) family protein